MNNAFPVPVFNPVLFWIHSMAWFTETKDWIVWKMEANSSFHGVVLGWGWGGYFREHHALPQKNHKILSLWLYNTEMIIELL